MYHGRFGSMRTVNGQRLENNIMVLTNLQTMLNSVYVLTE